MRGGSNPDGRIAAPGLLRFARNDGQGTGSLVSACRLGCLLDRKMIGGFIEDEPQGRQYPGRAASYMACHGGGKIGRPTIAAKGKTPGAAVEAVAGRAGSRRY